jgi:hypothetical protein
MEMKAVKVEVALATTAPGAIPDTIIATVLF